MISGCQVQAHTSGFPTAASRNLAPAPGDYGAVQNTQIWLFQNSKIGTPKNRPATVNYLRWYLGWHFSCKRPVIPLSHWGIIITSCVLLTDVTQQRISKFRRGIVTNKRCWHSLHSPILADMLPKFEINSDLIIPAPTDNVWKAFSEFNNWNEWAGWIQFPSPPKQVSKDTTADCPARRHLCPLGVLACLQFHSIPH